MPAAPVVHAVDANVILRHLLGDEPKLSSKAHAIFAALETGDVVLECDPVNLAEVVWVLASHYQVGRQQIAESLSPLVKAPGFRVPNKERYLLALELYGQGVLRFGDACACARALEACDGRLLSFDRKLSRVEGVTRREGVAEG
jgi:predicted nucleic acid-binding protein